jgi:hypothetical protein
VVYRLILVRIQEKLTRLRPNSLSWPLRAKHSSLHCREPLDQLCVVLKVPLAHHSRRCTPKTGKSRVKNTKNSPVYVAL